MNRERWRTIKRLFLAAVDKQSGERTAYLAAACAGDSALLTEVRSLLASHTQAGDFIERSMYEIVAGSGASTQPSGQEADRPSQGKSGDRVRSELAGLIRDYELIRVCGWGSFGTVWIVQDRAGAYRAMKVIEFGRQAGDLAPEREMQALEDYCRNVPQHPNLVQIYHIGRSERWLYYTMQLADDLNTGRPTRKKVPDAFTPMTLFEVMRRGRLRLDTAVEITLRLLSGVVALHLAELVHRDIKPANVIFVDREAKLADLSLVSVRRSHMSRAGTPRYMPPDERMDATADTYALGKVLYEMISGGDLADFPHLPVNERITSSKIDLEKLDAFVSGACAGSAPARFATATEMRSALLDCRYPLQDSLLLDLAERELDCGPDGSSSALMGLQRAVGRTGDPASERSGAADTADADSSGRVSAPADLQTGRLRSDSDGDPVLRILDRLIKLIPWLVMLLLGYYLIYRLTN